VKEWRFAVLQTEGLDPKCPLHSFSETGDSDDQAQKADSGLSLRRDDA